MPEMNPPEGPQGPQPSNKGKPWPNIWMITTFAVLAIFLLSMFVSSSGITGAAISGMSKEQAAQKSIDFINSQILGGQYTATLVNATEQNGLYFITFDVDGKDYTMYTSRDGKLLFPQVVDMEKAAVPTTEEPAIPTSDNPVVKFFVMSFCPYGQQAEAGLKPVAELLKGKATFEPHYVFYANYCGYGVACTGSPDLRTKFCLDSNQSSPKYCSMHGINELNEDVRQIYIYKNYPDKFWGYVNYINTKCGVDNVNTCWKDAANSVELDTAAIESGAKENALKYVADEAAADLKYSVQGSPTIFINGGEYNIQQGYAPETFKTSICSAFTTAPSECSAALSSNASAASGSCATP